MLLGDDRKDVPIVPPIELVQLGPAGKHLAERRRGLDLYVRGIGVLVPDDLHSRQSKYECNVRDCRPWLAMPRRVVGRGNGYGRALTLIVNLSSVMSDCFLAAAGAAALAGSLWAPRQRIAERSAARQGSRSRQGCVKGFVGLMLSWRVGWWPEVMYSRC
jgi:hypothetical protein